MRILPRRSEDQDHTTMFVSPYHDNVTAYCGHKIDIHRMPRTNCEQCWGFYFMHNHDFTKSVSQQYIAGQREQIVNEHGAKFVKRLEVFMLTVAKARELYDQVNKELLANKDVDMVISTDGVGG